jgi:hypothetical protein
MSVKRESRIATLVRSMMSLVALYYATWLVRRLVQVRIAALVKC